MFYFISVLKQYRELKFILDERNAKALIPDEEQYWIKDEVDKWTGDYHISGVVRAVFFTARGRLRYVVEHEARHGGSFLHIYSHGNLTLAKKGPRNVPLV